MRSASTTAIRWRASRSVSPSLSMTAAHAGFERRHHEHAQRLALAEDEVRAAADDHGAPVVGDRAHDARRGDSGTRAGSGSCGLAMAVSQSVSSSSPCSSSDETTRSLQVGALGDLVDDLAVEDVETQLFGQRARDLVAAGPVLPRHGHDRPPRLAPAAPSGTAASGGPAARRGPRASVSCASPFAHSQRPCGRLCQ